MTRASRLLLSRRNLRRHAWPLCAALLLIAGITMRLDAQQAIAVRVPSVVPATGENAAPFLGDWTLSATGANGPATFALSLKNDGGAVSGEISSEMMPRQTIKDISKSDAALMLHFMFDYQGTPVPVSITLTPSDGKIGVELDFAEGAYILTGAATKAPAKSSQ